jgi:hypothetical protein
MADLKGLCAVPDYAQKALPNEAVALPLQGMQVN